MEIPESGRINPQYLHRRRHTMPAFGWDDIEDIAIGLTEEHPELEPLKVRFTDLARMVSELPDFTGGPLDVSNGRANESRLEAIQMAWLDEVNDK
jgi:FeS assembly protein IscX